MATKKTTQKKKTSTKKTKTKEEKVNLTFRPYAGNAKVFTARLMKKDFDIVDGKKIEKIVPKIEGLPKILRVRVNEVYPVTQDQLKALQESGLVESDEEYHKRQDFLKALGKQHPRKLSYDQIEEDYINNAGVRQFEEFYSDKLSIL